MRREDRYRERTVLGPDAGDGTAGLEIMEGSERSCSPRMLEGKKQAVKGASSEEK